MRKVHSTRSCAAAALAGATVLALAACSGGGPADGGSDGLTAEDIDAALQQEATIEYWGWSQGMDRVVELFNETYPSVTVTLNNVGGGIDQYTKVQNAVAAGSGAPDVAQFEYQALPQFVLSGSLASLEDNGLGDIGDAYSESTWGQVAVDGEHFGFPQDAGPMVMFYREDVLSGLGLDAPTTWEEFTEVARAIRQDNQDNYITYLNPGDPGDVNSLLWQAGARPYAVDGTEVQVQFDDDGAARWTELWTTLLEEDLVEVAPGWSEDMWRNFETGGYAMWLVGAWAPQNIKASVPTSDGLWRVAPLPQWSDGETVTSENGGSSIAVLEGSQNKAAALAFARWLTTDAEALALQAEIGLFPAARSSLSDQEFLSRTDDFFGGQRVNQVLADAAASVGTGWSYLPFQVYANSVFGDTVGQALSGQTTLTDGFSAWQQAIVDYGNAQGFTVNGG